MVQSTGTVSAVSWLLGLVIAKASGIPYETYIEQRIFEPLGILALAAGAAGGRVLSPESYAELTTPGRHHRHPHPLHPALLHDDTGQHVIDRLLLNVPILGQHAPEGRRRSLNSDARHPRILRRVHLRRPRDHRADRRLRETNRTQITEQLGRGAANGHRVLESLFDRPIISVADAQAMTGTGFAATNQLVARLVDFGILREITGNARNRRFRYEPYVHLFTEDEQESA